jgi:hypothetical protein
MADPPTPDQPAEPAAPNDPPEAPTEPSRAGSIREQDGSTVPAAPSPAAARRRLMAEDAREAKRGEDERHRRTRRRVMIGSGVALGVVGIAAIIYWSAPGSTTTAHCVDDNDRPVAASYCDNGTHAGSFFLFAGSQYHYYYGGAVGSAGRYSGGSLAQPRSGTVRTDSGKTIQRGGFGGRVSHGTS